MQTLYVAEELRRLAEESESAAGTISNLIRQLQEATERTAILRVLGSFDAVEADIDKLSERLALVLRPGS
jgi:methyl-accepting chemotaxis protein